MTFVTKTLLSNMTYPHYYNAGIAGMSQYELVFSPDQREVTLKLKTKTIAKLLTDYLQTAMATITMTTIAARETPTIIHFGCDVSIRDSRWGGVPPPA